MEQVILRYAPDLYGMAEWAKDKPHLRVMSDEFDRLRQDLREVPILAPCAAPGCDHPPRRIQSVKKMTGSVSRRQSATDLSVEHVPVVTEDPADR
jgi:hypothetical protein